MLAIKGVDRRLDVRLGTIAGQNDAGGVSVGESVGCCCGEIVVSEACEDDCVGFDQTGGVRQDVLHVNGGDVG